MTLVEELTFRKLDRRLADYLQRSFVKEGLHLREVTATHEAIAAELGSAREVISRLLKEFERLGAIETARGRIRLRDAGILERVGRE
jgi:CRP/FNR family transcriptional regulator